MRNISLLVAPTAALLAGCASAPPGALGTEQISQLHHQITDSLTPLSLAANKDWLSGQVLLDITFNRQNQLLNCRAQSTSGAAGLVPVIERACWANVFPPMPAQVFNDDGKTVVRMPVYFEMDSQTDPKRRAYFDGVIFPMFSQGQYFWDNGISKVAFSSVGQAQLRYVADREGRVLTCNAVISPVDSRKDEFVQSPQLVSHLNATCLKMNLAQMPGFAVGNNGLAAGTVWTAYSPWRKTAPKARDY